MRVFSTVTVAFALLVASGAAASKPEVQQAAERLVATSTVPGVVTAIEQDGKRIVVAAGEADIARHQKMRPNGRFWVGSVTKAFIATVAMQLVAENRLGLDDTVEQLLPGRMREGHKVRLRHLLSHTSGIPEYMGIEPFRSAVAQNPRVVIPARRLVSAATRLPLEFEPGSQAAYSNTNYLVIGEILERATQWPIARLLRERIFRPLGLESTSFESGRGAVGGRRIRGYDVSGPRPRDVSLHRLGGPWADGALVSSAGDLAAFMGALLRGKLVPRSLVVQMRTVVDVPGSHGQGMGLFKLPSPCRRTYWGHTGGTPGYATFVAGSPDGRRIVVVAINGIARSSLQAMGKYLDRLLCS